MSVNTLQFLETENGTAVDAEATYQVVTLESGTITQEAQNVTTQTWYGENGEEAYIPSAGVNFKAYDFTFKLGVKATKTSSAIEMKNTFINAIKSKLWYSIYQPYTKQTIYSAYLSNVEEDKVAEDYVTFDVTFRVTNP